MADSEKDYYKILGVERSASEEEIKAAYKKMAIRYHPDRNPGDKSAEDKFKQAAEAYDVLRDPEKRSRYDQFGSAGIDGNGFQGFGAQMDMDDIFSMFGDIFGGHSPFSGGFSSRSGYARTSQGGNLRLRVKLTLEEIAKGVLKKFKVKKYIKCPECGGSGSEKGCGPEICPTCHGSGTVVHQRRTMLGYISTQSICPTCNGEGKIIKKKCNRCNGEGVIFGDEIMDVNIPAGVEEGMIVNVPGKGNAGRHGGPSGDLQIVIEEEPHKLFIRDGNDLVYHLLLTVPQAALGDTVEIPTLDGKTKISIKPGTQPGKVLRLRAKGLPSVKGYSDSGTGDLIVNVSVYIPEKLSEKEKEALEAFKEGENFKPAEKEKESILNKLKSFFER